jgi:hypothetical protein
MSNEAGVYLGRAGGEDNSMLQEFATVRALAPFLLYASCRVCVF